MYIAFAIIEKEFRKGKQKNNSQIQETILKV